MSNGRETNAAKGQHVEQKGQGSTRRPTRLIVPNHLLYENFHGSNVIFLTDPSISVSITAVSFQIAPWLERWGRRAYLITFNFATRHFAMRSRLCVRDVGGTLDRHREGRV